MSNLAEKMGNTPQYTKHNPKVTVWFPKLTWVYDEIQQRKFESLGIDYLPKNSKWASFPDWAGTATTNWFSSGM